MKTEIELIYEHAYNTAYNISLNDNDQPMFNETTGVNSQNRGYKTAVWQDSESVNAQWCGKWAYLDG
jgi:hypothetical protein